MKTRYFLIMIVLTGLFITGCVKDEIFEGPPVISNMTMSPLAPGDNDIVTITAKVTSNDGVKAVTLMYKIDGGDGTFTSVPMTVSGSTYSGKIPAQPSGSRIFYYIEAESNAGKKATNPADAPFTCAAYVVGAPSILMNEIYSRGIPETDPDWIEIYNNSDSPADISGYKIYDSGGQSGSKPKKEIPAGTTITAHGFVVIVTDDSAESGFGLSGDGEEIWLENPSGNIIDNCIFPALTPAESYGRYPDGAENWQVLYTITRGTANSNVIPDLVLIWMNEIYSRGTTENPDWIEIFNDSDKDIDLTGYTIYDSGGHEGTKPKKEFPAGTIIPTKGFYVIVTDDAAESGFGLSSGGEKVWLENTTGMIIDSVEFPALDTTQSYGRYPDGTENWQILFTITRGTANSNAVPGGVVLNELYSRGVTENPDWVEIFNNSPVEIDISGYKIYDPGGQAGTKPKKEFPAGSIVPAMGFLVIVVDTDDESGFGLSSGGDEVWLEDLSGTVIDNIAIPAMETTQSYGRYPDGSENWQLLNTITRGTANMP